MPAVRIFRDGTGIGSEHALSQAYAWIVYAVYASQQAGAQRIGHQDRRILMSRPPAKLSRSASARRAGHPYRAASPNRDALYHMDR